MRPSKLAYFSMFLSFLTTAALPIEAAASPTFTTVDVPGAANTVANGINRFGPLLRSSEIVGTYNDLSGSHSFLLSAGTVTQLDAPNPYQPASMITDAYGINNNHQIVGEYHDNTQAHYAGFLYYGGRFTPLTQCPFQPNYYNFQPHGINSAGFYVGTQQDGGLDNMLHYWGFAQTATTCVDFNVAGATQTSIYGVNSSGHSVGTYTDANGLQHGAMFYTPTQTGVTSATLDYPGASATVAYGINDPGVIVGYFDSYNRFRGRIRGGRHGFVYANGTFTSIDVPGGNTTEVHGINNPDPLTGSYNVVGSYYDGYGAQHGFVVTISPYAGNSPFIKRSKNR